MGQKIRPNSLRLGITHDWQAHWMPKKHKFGTFLEEDALIRKAIDAKIKPAGIDKVLIERMGSNCRISIRAARPGLIIGRGGKGIEDLSDFIRKKIKNFRAEKKIKEGLNININIEELKRSEISAAIIAQNVAWDMEKRKPYRRTLKKYIDQIMQNKEVKGVKIKASGRLGGAEIARREQLSRGKLPLQTLRANIDYGEATAFCTYGTVGIKVWVYKGLVWNYEVEPK